VGGIHPPLTLLTILYIYFDIQDGITIAVRKREHMATFSCIPTINFIIKFIIFLNYYVIIVSYYFVIIIL